MIQFIQFYLELYFQPAKSHDQTDWQLAYQNTVQFMAYVFQLFIYFQSSP